MSAQVASLSVQCQTSVRAHGMGKQCCAALELKVLPCTACYLLQWIDFVPPVLLQDPVACLKC